jgi:hypothetical protein
VRWGRPKDEGDVKGADSITPKPIPANCDGSLAFLCPLSKAKRSAQRFSEEQKFQKQRRDLDPQIPYE